VERDCAIGCFSGYAWSNVQVWARSLRATGFNGRKVALVRDADQSCRKALANEGFEVVDFSYLPVTSIAYVERFAFLRRYLRERYQAGEIFRWVIATDVRDVCFQRDPLDYLTQFEPPRLVLSQEGLRYAHEEWNAGNLRAAFGDVALEMLRDTPAYNVGVLAGGHRAMESLAFLIEQLARAARHPISDQASFNLLLSENLVGPHSAHRANAAEPWACQAGVMADPQRIERNRPHLLGPEPIWREGQVLTAAGEAYAILHQYDRVPAWRDVILRRYGSFPTSKATPPSRSGAFAVWHNCVSRMIGRIIRRIRGRAARAFWPD